MTDLARGRSGGRRSGLIPMLLGSGPYLPRMLAFLAAVGAVATVLFAVIRPAFMANPPLNGLILGVLALGILYLIRQVLLLVADVRWLHCIRLGQTPTSDLRPRLLAPMAFMLGDRIADPDGPAGRLRLSAPTVRSLLDGVASRLDEGRDLSRYLVGLLIFLGLLGTFWGLLQTVSAIGDVIGGLRLEGADVAQMFSALQDGLRAPLAGMGTAFSSSLFGLAGSLVLGFLELQATQAQNRFYREFEDWLASTTRLPGGSTEVADTSAPAYLQALIETMAENIERLHFTLVQSDDRNRTAGQGLTVLSERLVTLSDQMRAEQQLMRRLAESQLELRPILQRLSETLVDMPSLGFDEATRVHIRNLEVYAARLLEEGTTGRDRAVQELRNEIKILTRTIAAKNSG